MCPSADRTSTQADNDATFFMTNMVPQAPDNNQGPWAAYENYLRTFLPGNEIYIISGGTGTGGVGSSGSASVLASGVTVPAVTWKVAMILPVGDNDVARVDGNTRSISVIMPNVQGIRSDQWQKYLATVDQVEALSSYNFYSNVPAAIQDQFEAKLDQANDTAPVANNGSATTLEE
jgi:endonuclease G